MDEHHIFSHHSLHVAKRSLDKNNLPFGCILVDNANNIIEEAENTVLTSKDQIAHCEVNLIHQISGKYDDHFLQSCILYASTEPCPMCTGAIFWSGIGKIVYALSKEGYHEIAGTTNPSHIFNISSKDLLIHGGRRVEVFGPVLEQEAKDLYRSWLF